MKFIKNKIFGMIGMVSCPILTFYLLECYTHNPFTTMRVPIQLLNIVFFELIMLLFFFLFGSLKAALLTETGFFMLVGLANYFVMQFRSIPIMPWDLFSLKTAVSVADNYKYHLNQASILTLLGFLLLFFLEWNCSLRLERKIRTRIAGVFVSLLLLWGFVLYLHQDSTILKFRIYDKLFTPAVMTKRDGTALAFLIELEYMAVDKPDGYRASEMSDFLASYEETEPPKRKPNIIVIMDEAFSDMSVLGNVAANQDYMPFIHSLLAGAQNTISGSLHVSILGGNTPNTEFEYLTGNSLAFLPQGSVPFQQYLTKPLTSIPSYLKKLGYQTIAMHPYYSTGWERDTVYPLLGFDTSYFLNDFGGAAKVRNYVSDQACVDRIIAEYEKKEQDTPLFLFTVTMQNHSSYAEEFDNFIPSITVDDAPSNVLPNYLSLLKLTDDAISNLLTYFKAADEDTVVVFFGDHQPTNSVVEPIWKAQGKSSSSLTEEEEFLRYQVPYFIWTNYEMEANANIESSPNYLGAKTLEVAGLTLPPYFSYLQEIEMEFPTISALFVTDKHGTITSVKEQRDALNTYAKLQYYQLFDLN